MKKILTVTFLGLGTLVLVVFCSFKIANQFEDVSGGNLFTKYFAVTNLSSVSSSENAEVTTKLITEESPQNVSEPVKMSQTAPKVLSQSAVSSSGATQTVPAGFREYRNQDYHFVLFYPPTLSVKEYSEGPGAKTVTFSGGEENKSFQIYITPYSGSHITKEQFLLDVPLGVMEQPTNVMIGGTSGTMFFSKNEVMGDTREVWFIKDGFLYEVTTYKELDAWLSDIMRTWKFI